MAISAAGTDQIIKQRFRFVVDVPGIPAQVNTFGPVRRAKFSSCSELAASVEPIIIRHGGSPLPFKMPGEITMADVTLAFGATNDGSLYRWFMQTAAAGSGALGSAGVAYKRTVRIAELERHQFELSHNIWSLVGAFPIRFAAGEWDGASDEFTIGSVTLTYDYFVASRLEGAPSATDVGALAARL
jgi:phage tail-like protein